jgi:syntaxin-binding protein 1
LEKQAGKIRLVILDRALDPLTPLLHDFFYQPMIYDLLNITSDIVDYESEA